MPAVIARIVSLESDPFPGRARVALELADGSSVEVHEKQPVLGIQAQAPGAVVHLACEVTEDVPDGVTVLLQAGVETTDGRATVKVNRNQITDFE
jgi:hypothetical protein